ncbi:MAG: MFS transporter, partial [Pseudonocardia sp.]|nr:MFS transporter [Pseudonocardia sp.]
LVGCCAGVAFLTGLTIIGSQVANEVRGRVVAFVQSIVRLDLLASMSVVPVAVGLVQTRTVDVFGTQLNVDGTRTVLGMAGLIASVVGVLAYRQMDDRRSEPLLPDLLGALRRGDRRPVGGVLIAVEGGAADESAEQAARLVDWLRAEGYVAARCGELGADARLLTETLLGGDLSGTRARALAAAAVRADVVEREIRPALRAGEIVVVDRFLAGPLARLGATTPERPGGAAEHTELDGAELNSLASWATGRLRPDVTVLLDRAPTGPDDPDRGDPLAIAEEHLPVRRWLTRMAAAEPHRYVVVDADAAPDVVHQRVTDGIRPVVRTAVRRRATPPPVPPP